MNDIDKGLEEALGIGRLEIYCLGLLWCTALGKFIFSMFTKESFSVTWILEVIIVFLLPVSVYNYIHSDNNTNNVVFFLNTLLLYFYLGIINIFYGIFRIAQHAWQKNPDSIWVYVIFNLVIGMIFCLTPYFYYKMCSPKFLLKLIKVSLGHYGIR